MKVSVILATDEEMRFSAYCRSKGYKKSTLIVRLIREHLDREQFAMQKSMFRDFIEERREGVSLTEGEQWNPK